MKKEIKIEELDYNKPIDYYCDVYGVCINTIRSKFKKLGIYNNFLFTRENNSIVKSKILKNEYEKNPKKCLNCFVVIRYDKRKNNYCSRKCSALYTQRNGGHCKWNDTHKKEISEKLKAYYQINKKPKTIKIQICKNCNKEFNNKNKRICCSRNCFEEWNKKTGYLKGKSGGLREGAGRSKSGWYKGYYCNSTYELAWVIYSIDNNVKFKRNTLGFDYVNSKGLNSKYYPDFYIEETKTFVEIKGYKEKEFYNKQNSFKQKIIVLDKKNIKPILQYVKNKYGNNFIELYENNPHKIKNNCCKVCGKPAKFNYCSRVCSGKAVRKLKELIDKSNSM